MACPAILTGDQFLTRVLGSIDCQAQIIGTFGWQALGQPGSLASSLMLGLLTLFVALFGFRLLFGPPPGARDLVNDILKVGIVATLAFSWPAFQILLHDVVLEGPAEIAVQAGSGVMPGTAEGGLVGVMQQTDNAMLRLIELGTGRSTGQLIDSQAPGGTFRSATINDENGFGYARMFWLTGIIGSLALMRLLAGLLLALTPLTAGFLLFEPTRGLFAGWIKGLVLAVLGAVGVSLVIAVELSVLGPLLGDALRLRQLGYATPAVPTELLSLTLAFALVQFALIGLLARLAYTRGWLTIPRIEFPARAESGAALAVAAGQADSFHASRSDRIVESVETQLRRERGVGWDGSGGTRIIAPSRGDSTEAYGSGDPFLVSGPDRLGSSWRRTTHRISGAARRRDGSQ